MPQRMLGLWLCLAGLFLVVAMLLMGRDLRRAALTGPAWRRRMLAAGLVLLSWIGVLPASAQSPATQPAPRSSAVAATPTTSAADPLLTEPAWQRINQTWKDAKSNNSFAPDVKQKLLARLAGLAQDIDSLNKPGLLSDAEAKLLKESLGRLTTDVQMLGVTCYAPVPPTAPQAASRTGQRLLLLRQLLIDRRVRPEVIEKALLEAERDLREMNDGNLRNLPEGERAYVEATREAALRTIAALRTGAAGGKIEVPPDPFITYTVKPGDTLWSIARKELGAGSRAHDIIDLNAGIDRDRIQPGQVIRMPATRPAGGSR